MTNKKEWKRDASKLVHDHTNCMAGRVSAIYYNPDRSYEAHECLAAALAELKTQEEEIKQSKKENERLQAESVKLQKLRRGLKNLRNPESPFNR